MTDHMSDAAQPMPQPVAWRWKFPGDRAWTISNRFPGSDVEGVQPLYAAQPPAAPVETLSPEQWVDKLREGTEFAETPLSRSSADNGGDK